MPKNTMFSFISIPRNAKELCAMPEYHMKSPFARAALTVLVLCHYSISPEDTIEMLNLLLGPSTLSAADISALSKSLNEHEYIPYSFFANATPENGYEPSLPFVISVKDTTFSYTEPGFVTVYVQSSGAETSRSIKLRKKESTGEWFLWDQKLLDPIQKPQKHDPYK